MSIYLVNADRLHFSAKQLEAMTRLPSCGDLGGITEGVAWVRDNDDDIIVLASEWRPDSFFQLLPRRYMSHNIYALQRAADYLMACGTDWLAGPKAILEERLLALRKIWGIEILVLNYELAEKYNLINNT